MVAKRPAACPQTCQLFDNDLSELLHEVSQIMDTDIAVISMPSGSELDSLLETLDMDIDTTLEALDTSGSECPHCGSKPDKT